MPMVNHGIVRLKFSPVGDSDVASFDVHIATFEEVSNFAGIDGHESRGILEFARNARFSQADVSVPRADRFLIERRSIRRRSREPDYNQKHRVANCLVHAAIMGFSAESL